MVKLITDFSHKTKPQLLTLGVRIRKPFATTGMGLVGNTYFTWTGTSAADCVTAGNDYRDAVDDNEGGGELTELAEKAAREIFIEKLKGIAVQGNTQQSGTEAANEVALASTGLPFAEEGGEVGEMDKASINHIDPVDGVTGFADANIKTSQKTCYGTHIEVQNVATGIIVYSHSRRKHIIRIGGFTHGVDSMVRVAYDGANPTIVWSDWFPYLGK